MPLNKESTKVNGKQIHTHLKITVFLHVCRKITDLYNCNKINCLIVSVGHHYRPFGWASGAGSFHQYFLERKLANKRVSLLLN